jgi:hypothetical protein
MVPTRVDLIPVISRLADLFPGSASPEFAPKPLKKTENLAEIEAGCDFYPVFPGETGIYGEPMPGIA